MTGTVGYVVRGSVAIYYAKYYLGGNTETVAAFLSTGVAAAILSMIASTWITKFYCKVKLFRYTKIGVANISALIYIEVKPGDMVLAFMLYFLLSFVVDLHAPVFWSVIPGVFHLIMGSLMFKYRISDEYFVGVKDEMRNKGYVAA